MKKTTTNTNVGRPTKKTPGRIAKTLELAREGKTNVQIAEIIGVAESTIRHWKSMDFEFSAAVNELKQEANAPIVGSLYKRAMGMEYYEEQPTKDGIVVVKKYALPDVRAQQYWLNNRSPKRWKNNVEIVHEAGATLALNLGTGQKKFDV